MYIYIIFLLPFFYRSQRSCRKVMFLHLSVILFTGGSLSKGGSLSREVSVRQVSVQRGLCPGGVTIQGVSVGGSLSRGSLSAGARSMGVSVWGFSVLGFLSGKPPSHRTVTCGWCASYWNAFLFFFGQSIMHDFNILKNFPYKISLIRTIQLFSDKRH